MSDDFTAFIGARLDEMERAALAATQGEWSARRAWPSGAGGWEVVSVRKESYGSSEYDVVERCPDGGGANEEDARHIARHDPAAVLCDVTAMRLILAMYDDARSEPLYPPDEEGRDDHDSRLDALEGVVVAMASRWATHQDYQQEWTP